MFAEYLIERLSRAGCAAYCGYDAPQDIAEQLLLEIKTTLQKSKISVSSLEQLDAWPATTIGAFDCDEEDNEVC